jgi:hypothetical protein
MQRCRKIESEAKKANRGTIKKHNVSQLKAWVGKLAIDPLIM